MRRVHMLRAAMFLLAFVTIAGPPARADDRNHAGLAVEWLYPTESYCDRIALGDLDADGDPDLVVAEGIENGVSLWWNDGQGRFDERSRLATGPARHAIAILDVDGDGRLDLVIGRPPAEGGVEVHRNLGGRRFAPPLLTASGTPLGFRLVAADMNGDGRADLVGIALSAERTIGVALNRGGGVFEGVTTLALGVEGLAVAVADFDGDGTPDVACAPSIDPIHGFRILKGDGAGGLSPLGDFDAVYPDGPRGMWAVDLDEDGDADLLTATEEGSLGIQFNDGSGGFSGFLRYTGSSGYGVGVGVGQLDGDANSEIVVGAASRSRGSHFDVHQAGADPRLEHGLVYSYYHCFNYSYPSELAPDQIEVGDLNGDGSGDLVLFTRFMGDGECAPAGSRIGVVLSRPNGALGALAYQPTSPMRGLRTARFDPGRSGLVLFGSDGIHRAGLGAAGRLETPRRVADGIEAWPLDANGDGRDDLVVAVTADTLALLLTRRDGEVGDEVARWAGRWLAGGDLGGRPGAEVVFRAPDGTVSIAWSHPQRPYARRLPAGLPGSTGLFTVGHVDPRNAALIRFVPGPRSYSYDPAPPPDTVRVYRFLPSERLEATVQSLVSQAAGSYAGPGRIVSADMDGRSGDELVIIDLADWTGRLDVVWSTGEGRYAREPARYILYPEGPHSLVVEDLDGDGYRDVFWIVQQEASVDRIHVMWNDGNGGLGDLWTRYAYDGWVGSPSVGDLDGDGTPDLAMTVREFATATYDHIGILYGDRLRAERKVHGPREARPAGVVSAGDALRLGAVGPNPASSALAVSFSIARSGPLELDLFDLAGRRVAAERLDAMAEGEHEFTLRIPDGLGNGIYWLALRQGSIVATRRVTIVR